jgi:hypothetical protein
MALTMLLLLLCLFVAGAAPPAVASWASCGTNAAMAGPCQGVVAPGAQAAWPAPAQHQGELGIGSSVTPGKNECHLV